MIAVFRNVFGDAAANLRSKIVGVYLLLIGFNVVAWVWALSVFRDYPVLLGTAVLAYCFGVRHAIDADHIAAIDNVTRKLMQQGQRPVGVGFFFSLGHSTVVAGLSLAIALTTAALQSRFDFFRNVGELIGTSVSAFFLFAIAIANIIILAQVWRTFQKVRRGGRLVEQDLDMLLGNRGFFARMFRGLFRLIERSWHMYPLGFLFGLGFDTATEVGLLGISATGAAKGLSIWSILIFPALFTAGMSLADTTDSTLMLGAYGWAFVKPIRKLYYNMTITAVSVVVALLIGGIEALSLLADKLDLRGGIWDLVGALNENFGTIGYFIIGIFLVSWLVSAIIYHLRRYDEIDVRIS